MLYPFIGKLTPLSRGDIQPISFCRKKVRQEVASRNVLFFRHLWHIVFSQRSPSPSVQRTYLGNNVWEHVLLNFISSVNVVVQFYPWFKFSFLLFLGMVMYDNNMIMSLKQKKRKFEPRIKLNHNINKRQLLLFIVSPSKIDQTKNQNRSIDKVRNKGNQTR